MHNIDSALIYALIALFQMASSNKDSCVQDLRKLICINHSRGWLVNGEGSGRTEPKLSMLLTQERDLGTI